MTSIDIFKAMRLDGFTKGVSIEQGKKRTSDWALKHLIVFSDWGEASIRQTRMRRSSQGGGRKIRSVF